MGDKKIIEKEKKHAKMIDVILLVISLGVILGMFVYYQDLEPVALSPSDKYETRNTFVLFEFENAETILIDDNIEFSSPEKFSVKDNFVIKLKPGIYYWKLEGKGESEIRTFSIESEVSLKLREKEAGKYEIVNVGNTELEVDVYEFGKLKENVVLDVYSSKEVSGDKFIGGRND